jgi:hypothetical protein
MTPSRVRAEFSAVCAENSAQIAAESAAERPLGRVVLLGPLGERVGPAPAAFPKRAQSDRRELREQHEQNGSA